MKKADMIKKIQEKDAKLYLEMKKYEQLFGEDSKLTTLSRREWCSIDALMKELDIKSDFTLPEWNLAIEIAQEIKMVKQFEADDFAKRDIGYPL
jgi:hypothetical protein